MRISFWWTTGIATLTTAALLTVGWLVLRPAGPALERAAFSIQQLTPNADGQTDVTRLTYRLRRPAQVSIYFLNAQGQRFDFRRAKPRAAGEHSVDFSGVVEAFRQPDETLSNTLLTRVLPDGDYTWVAAADDAAGGHSEARGALNVTQADTSLPELLNLSASPAVFSPNQDGVNDRARVNVYLSKDVAANGLHVYLIGPDGAQIPLAEASGAIEAGERGLHAYDYDGGIDLGENPPPDGVYTVRAEAVDRVGQRLTSETQLTIQRGGLPRADIYQADVAYSATTLRLGETLYFTLTVENYGAAPLRTSGPPSGFVYPSMSSNSAAINWYEQSGAWRVGLHCETCARDYPWRWALGTPETLTALVENGQTYDYLMPGQRVVITGGVVLDEIVDARNPQYFWAGLIHEDVEIAAVNNRVDPNFVTILPAP